MDKIPQFGDEIKEKEFTMTNGVTFVNHGSYPSKQSNVYIMLE
jgi:hypothetical protein